MDHRTPVFLRRTLPILLPVTVVLAGLAVVAWLFATRAMDFMEDSLKMYLRTSAGLAAQQFSAADIARVRTTRDIETPEFRRLVTGLQEIRRNVFSARFAYIFRRTNDPSQLAFVADADALLPLEEVDVNGNGAIDPDEEPGMPGDLYDISSDPVLQGGAFLAPIAGDFYIDQWGELISGYAPIHDETGKTVAVVGIDMQAGEFRRLARSIISPFMLGAAFLVAVILGVYLSVIIWRRQLLNLRVLASERSALIDLAMHQIGAPLATFRWWVEILQDQDADRMTIDRLEAYGKLQEGIHRMDEVIQALKKASDLHHGDMAYTREMASLREIVDGVIAKLQPQLAKRQQNISSSVGDDLRAQLDRKLIAGVLHEIIDNAMTYSPEHTTIGVRAVRERGMIQVTVQDSGCGMDAEDLAQVFTPLKRGKEAMKYKPVGNGLGLYVCKGIIEKGGGSIEVDSEKGKGTTVRFTLPAA